MKRSDLIGKYFGELQVIGFSEISRNGHSRWLVKCSCGIKKTVLGTHLLQGKTTSCGHKLKESNNWKGGEFIPLTYFSSIKRGALGFKNRRAIDFNVTISYLDKLWKEQDGKCAISSLPISFKAHTASLDRIDNSIGYLESNVQWVHKDINMMKRHYTMEYFLYLCKQVSNKID